MTRRWMMKVESRTTTGQNQTGDKRQREADG